MKLTVNKTNQVITYDAKSVLKGNHEYAYYDSSSVTCFGNETRLGQLYRSNGDTYGICFSNRNFKVRSDIYTHTLKNAETDEILATFEGTCTGAVAAYICYMHLSIKFGDSKIPCIESNGKKIPYTPTAPSAYTEPPKQTKPKSKDYIVVKEQPPIKEEFIPKEIIPKKEKLEEYKPEEPKREEFKYEEKRNFDPPRIQIPSGGEGGGGPSNMSGCGCVFAIIAVIGVFVAIAMIPQSWKDLSSYIPAGDSGITICFFSSLIGGVIAVLMSIFSKEPKFTSCIQAFLTTCIVGIVLNAIIVLAEGVEFTGFFLFDIPSAIFAPILGCFQFALPIGIATCVICGIICSAKKK